MLSLIFSRRNCLYKLFISFELTYIRRALGVIELNRDSDSAETISMKDCNTKANNII